MFSLLRSEETGANSPFKYTWDNIPSRGTQLVKSPLFGPENSDTIKFQLSIKCGYHTGSLHLFLISSEERSLSFKFKLIGADRKIFYSTNSIPLLVNKGMATLTIGQSCELSSAIPLFCCSIQCELQLDKPYKKNLPIVNAAAALEKKLEFKTLISDLNSLRYNSRFVDVHFLLADGKHLAANKMILSARSPVFSVMFDQTQFTENWKNQVQITDIDGQTFEALLDFIYNSEVKQLDQIAPSLLAAAHKYQIESLFEVCAKSMMENIVANNAVYYLMLAKTYSLAELKDKAIDLINRNAQIVANSEDFIKHVKPDHSLMQELYLDFVKKQSKI